MDSVNIKALNERIERESAFVDIIQMEMGKVIVGQKQLVDNLMIGLLTPPVGMCLYATARVADLSLDRMIKAILPFYIPLILALLAITYIPGIVTWLPNLLIH
mgnify:CR=1 FL=1